MRFAPESDHGANAGLKVARDLLEPVKRKFQSCVSLLPRSLLSDLFSNMDLPHVHVKLFLAGYDVFRPGITHMRGPWWGCCTPEIKPCVLVPDIPIFGNHINISFIV